MRALYFMIFTLGLTGCANLANRLVVTPSCDKAYALSLYGPVGLSSELSANDTAAVCAARGAK
jgi:hypothetical protein